jgi:hypothetical protein
MFHESGLKKKRLTMVQINQPIQEAFLFHLPLDIERWEVNRFVTQAESTPMYDH